MTTNWISLEGRKYAIAPGERALGAMLRQGAPVNFSCRKGTCRSCMLQVEAGDPGVEAVEKLPDDLRALGLFLPCCSTNASSVQARRPDLSLITRLAVVAKKEWVAPGILALKLECAHELDWQAGQIVRIFNPRGEARSYSIVGGKDQYYIEIHVRVYEGGAVSGWLDQAVEVGGEVQFQGPSGEFVYNSANADGTMILIGTGTGGGALMGIARDALAKGHRGPVFLYHGARSAAELYLARKLADTPKGRLHLVQAASREAFGEMPPSRVVDIAFGRHKDLSDADVYLCGNAEMVEAARIRAVASGASLSRIHADPFDPPAPYVPQDDAKLQSIERDDEMWQALGKGTLLSEILRDFYTQVYADPLLAPFFQRTTIQRAIEKQYNFLQDIFSGTKLYFGLKPFNAHHWMVISDELFDYREELFFSVVADHDFPEHLVRRWRAIHEMFRREIVKSTARGLLHAGKEVDLEGYERETLSIGSVCDGCKQEIAEGAEVLMHRRTGEIFCLRCEEGS